MHNQSINKLYHVWKGRKLVYQKGKRSLKKTIKGKQKISQDIYTIDKKEGFFFLLKMKRED